MKTWRTDRVRTQFLYQPALGAMHVRCTPDGNCLFRALSRALQGNEKAHGRVRGEIADYLAANAELFENDGLHHNAEWTSRLTGDSMKTSYKDYVQHIRTPHSFGDTGCTRAFMALYPDRFIVHIWRKASTALHKTDGFSIRERGETGEYFKACRVPRKENMLFPAQAPALMEDLVKEQLGERQLIHLYHHANHFDLLVGIGARNLWAPSDIAASQDYHHHTHDCGRHRMRMERALSSEGERDPALAGEAATAAWGKQFFDDDVAEIAHDLIDMDEEDEVSAPSVVVLEHNSAARQALRDRGARLGYTESSSAADAICADPEGGATVAVVGRSGEVEQRLSVDGAMALAKYRCSCGLAGTSGDVCLRFLKSGNARRAREAFYGEDITSRERGRLVRREMQHGMEMDGKGGWTYMFNVKGYRICHKTWREVFKVQTSLWHRVVKELEAAADIPVAESAPAAWEPLRVRVVTGATEKVSRGESIAGKVAHAWLQQYSLMGEQMPQSEKTSKPAKQKKRQKNKPAGGHFEAASDNDDDGFFYPGPTYTPPAAAAHHAASAPANDAAAGADHDAAAGADHDGAAGADDHHSAAAAGADGGDDVDAATGADADESSRAYAAAVAAGEVPLPEDDTVESDIGNPCEIRLAETLRKDVHETYVHAMMLREEKFVHRTTFLAMWKRDFPHLKCARPKGTHAMCGVRHMC